VGGARRQLTDDQRLADQIRYYRLRASEYDATSYADPEALPALIGEVLDFLQPYGAALELACGTGIWTEHLAPRVTSLLAVDTSPEVIALARRRASGGRFVVGDAFRLPLRGTFDAVFMAAWLSHVPTDLFASFWEGVAGLLAPGGRALFLDEAPAPSRREMLLADDVAVRELQDGTTHRLVKVFWTPEDLTHAFDAIGWDATIQTTERDWLMGAARPR
jgi:SAM-dependent methyltransferase